MNFLEFHDRQYLRVVSTLPIPAIRGSSQLLCTAYIAVGGEHTGHTVTLPAGWHLARPDRGELFTTEMQYNYMYLQCHTIICICSAIQLYVSAVPYNYMYLQCHAIICIYSAMQLYAYICNTITIELFPQIETSKLKSVLFRGQKLNAFLSK